MFRRWGANRQKKMPTDQRSARTLVPTIEKILDSVAWRPDEIDLIAVTTGPGSFTGLRIGVTTAKTLAYATNSQVIGVSTLDVVAHRAFGAKGAKTVDGPLHVLMDAQRKQFFWAEYDGAEGGSAEASNTPIQMLNSPEIVDQEAWIGSRTSNDWLTGPGLLRCKFSLGAAQVVDETLWTPTATAVGQVALKQFAANGADDLWKLVPHYYRKSAAEEKHESNG